MKDCRFFAQVFINYFQILMIISEKSYQNLSDNIQFYSKTYLSLMKKKHISSDKMRNSGNYIYDYAHSFFGKDL